MKFGVHYWNYHLFGKQSDVPLYLIRTYIFSLEYSAFASLYMESNISNMQMKRVYPFGVRSFRSREQGRPLNERYDRLSSSKVMCKIESGVNG